MVVWWGRGDAWESTGQVAWEMRVKGRGGRRGAEDGGEAGGALPWGRRRLCALTLTGPRRPCLHPARHRVQAAVRAKEAGSTRFCMGAAWRGPSQVGKGQWERVLEMVG